jgi:adenylate kinase
MHSNGVPGSGKSVILHEADYIVHDIVYNCTVAMSLQVRATGIPTGAAEEFHAVNKQKTIEYICGDV